VFLIETLRRSDSTVFICARSGMAMDSSELAVGMTAAV